MAVFNRVYSPLGTQISMLVAEGSLKQDYDADNKIYTPDRRIRPTAIQPVCSITDPSGILENGTVNLYITDIKWYENEISEANLISPTNSKYKIDSTSNTNNRGRIIVYKNVNFDAPVTLIFTATFADMVNGKLRRKAYFVGTSVLASNVAASSPAVLKTDYPRGRCFNPIKGLTYLKLSADLVAGETSIPSAYWWYKKNGSAESLITDYVGHNSRELEVPTASIGKEQHYVCKVQDCRQNLTDVRNEYLQEELDKISDYPRNLLGKQYFLDLNDEIKPGVVTEGEDADGKYICVPNPFALRTYVGGNEQRDLFSGKMSFKENTAYVLRVVGKYVSETESQWGFAFIIAYTDGTFSSALRFDYMANKKIEAVHKSTPGKTISHISCTYGFDIPSYIYGIQITEEYNYNLLEGDTEEVTINIEDNGTNSDNYKLAARNISKSLNAGNKVTVSIGDVVNLKGESTEYTVLIYQIKESGNQSIGSVLSASKKTSILTIPSSFNSADPCVLYLYAGKSGATAGNSVKYNSVQLIEGEYAWNVLGEDVEEVTVEAGEKENARSGILIPNKLTVGGKYTIAVDDIVSLKGEETEYTVLVRQNRESSIPISDTISISQNKKNAIITINDQYQDGDYETILYVYAGQAGSTAGNTVQFKNIRLLQGETVLPSMPSYTPHFIPSAPDIEVESERITLPEGYRPDVQGKTINHEFTLVTRLPPYRTSVITPYGNDSGVISIPSDVKLFPAWIQVDVAGIGTLDNPEKYFSADWGNGLKGMNVLLDADDIGLGVQEVEPDVVEGMEHVKYGLAGYFSAPTSNLEKIETGTRLVVECDLSHTTASRPISIRKNKYGFYITIDANKKVLIYIVFNDLSYRANGLFEPSNPMLIDIRMGDTSDESSVIINGITYKFNSVGLNLGFTSDDAFYIYRELRTSLIEIYKDDTLLHKWDFEGSTSAERLSDKAETENKISIVMGDGSEFIPV
ncbi:hypothetical protein INE81_01355 [Bacteroides salyersiae]|uniref:hypothetical protein n=1 Tax=Bacteroides salyersiae TaxID=291644 RepID=UPI001B8C9DAB|nr:hypothetical protein [Bacteroides salyersiae]QUT74912.1 hypothetical protein INE81_01355 [Bacteroides salyersiae]